MKALKYIFMVALMAPVVVTAQEPAPAPAEATAAPASEATPADQPAAVEEAKPSAGEKLVDSVKDKLEEKAEAMTAEEQPAEAQDLLQDASKVYSDWKAAGWKAGLLALVSLLMGFLRFGPINDFFKSKQIMWLKPILAAVFGAVGGGLTAAMAGAAVGPALVSGVLAGLAAIGLYEVTKRRKVENRTS